jgi:putative NADH-flavin reductase
MKLLIIDAAGALGSDIAAESLAGGRQTIALVRREPDPSLPPG